MIVGYQKGMHVLTVGDGDFSFSIAIAKAVIDKEDASSSGMVVATSYENEQTLQNVYPEFTTNLHQLINFNHNTKRKQNITIGYNVDATNLATTLPTSINNQCNYYHRIVWNFPCTAILDGQDGQNNEMEHNKELVRKFVCSALPYMSDTGGSEIHLLHKTKPPFNQWLLEKVALEGLAVSNIDDDGVTGDDDNDLTKSRQRRSRVLEYKGRLVFDKCIYQPYTPRKALDKRSFPCHDACVYIFGWKEEGKKYDKKYNDEHADSSRGLIQSTIPESNNNNLTLVKGGECDDLKSFSSQLTMVVTPEVIDRIRSVHIEYATKKKRMTNSTIQGADDSITNMTSKRRRRK